MKNITDEIFQIGGSGITSQEDAAVYLIVIEGRGALIDTGCGKSVGKLENNIVRCGIHANDVDWILLTHCHFDHTGGLKALKNICDCDAVAHEADAIYIEQGNTMVTAANWYGSTMEPVNIEVKLTGKQEKIDLCGRKIRAIHTPGHTPGSVVYLMESGGKRILFGQDIHGPLHPDFFSDRLAYQNSLRLIRSFNAEILCEGHYGIYHGKKVVRRFIESFIEN